MSNMVIDAADLCEALEAQLRANIGPVITALGLGADNGTAFFLDTPHDYQQDPDVAALINADVPAVGIAAIGTIGDPVRLRSSGTWAITFQIEVVVIDQGYDHVVTQRKARKWGTVVKAAVLLDESLGKLANGTKPSGEQYLPTLAKNAAFTSAVSLTFDITVEQALNITDLQAAITPEPTVTTVIPSVAVTINEE